MKSLSLIKESLKIEEEPVEEVEATELELNEDTAEFNPPSVLMLKRKAIRVYPNRTRIALYYNDKLKRYFSIPYNVDPTNLMAPDTPLQAEENVNEAVMDTLHNIVKNKQAQSVKFATGHTKKVDGFTASAMTQVHNALNDENKKKYADMVHKSPEHFEKARAFAFKHVK